MQNLTGDHYQRASRCCPNQSILMSPTPSKIEVPTTVQGTELLCCCTSCSTSTTGKTPGFLASFGVCILVLGYTLLGAFAFMALEGGFKSDPSGETGSMSTVKADASGSEGSSSMIPALREDKTAVQLRARTVERLWSLTEDLNVLYKENWTRLAAREVLEFQESLARDLRRPLSSSVYESLTPTRRQDLHDKPLHSRRWTFSSSLLYSLTLITTIGYGSVAPRTLWGRLITIVYALVGIPLMLVYLTTVGDVLARSFRKLYARMCRSRSCARKQLTAQAPPPVSGIMEKAYRYDNHVETKGAGNFYATSKENACDDLSTRGTGSAILLDCGSEGLLHPTTSFNSTHQDVPDNEKKHHYPCNLSVNSTFQSYTNDSSTKVKVPVTLCLSIIILYICGGAVMFNRLEGWTLLEGGYFCFTSLGTIGFGDLLPAGRNASTSTLEELSLCACCLYILVGMALMAMSFNLVQEEVIRLIRVFGKLCGMSSGTMVSGQIGGPGSGNGVKSEPEDALGVSTESRLLEREEEAIAMSVVSSS